MATKQIPFNLRTAKKIQEGEIEGKIITKNKIPCRIVAYCDSGDIFIQRVTLESHCDWCYPYTRKGCYIDGHLNGGTDYDLVLEVPDTESQKPQFNPSYSIEQLNKLKEYTKQLMEVNQGVIDDLGNMLQELKKICNSPLKTELKPFDRVLVRKPDLIDPHDIYEPDEWVPTLFQGVSNDGCYFIAEHKEWNECIPYEGNEDLVGTADKP